jgi:hypothetical protein
MHKGQALSGKWNQISCPSAQIIMPKIMVNLEKCTKILNYQLYDSFTLIKKW